MDSMPILGAHISVESTLADAVLQGKNIGCDTIQIFTKDASTLHGAFDLTEHEIAVFKRTVHDNRMYPVVAHSSFLINLANHKPQLRKQFIKAFADELFRCNALGIQYLVVHPGSHIGSGIDTGLRYVVDGLNKTCEEIAPGCVIALETTAGQGTNLGYLFGQIAFILNEVDDPERFCVCLDTCHIFAAGYDIRTRDAYEATMSEFDTVIGLDQLQVIHMNDSLKGLGSKVDRHEHISKGKIGLAAFHMLVNDPRLSRVPMILETEEPALNLARLRALVGLNDLSAYERNAE